MNRTLLRTAFLDTVPVMTGYLCLGFGFGIVMQQNGLGLLWALALSLFVYAGSMQYVAVGLLTSGAGLLTTALTTLAVNARHLFYGLSMIDTYKDMGKKKPYLIFALTDETYSGSSLPRGRTRAATSCWCQLWISSTGYWGPSSALWWASCCPSTTRALILR